MYLASKNCNLNFDQWLDSNGNGCESYKTNNWCTPDGNEGSNWNREKQGYFMHYINNGFTAYNCPQCGCKGNLFQYEIILSAKHI